MRHDPRAGAVLLLSLLCVENVFSRNLNQVTSHLAAPRYQGPIFKMPVHKISLHNPHADKFANTPPRPALFASSSSPPSAATVSQSADSLIEPKRGSKYPEISELLRTVTETNNNNNNNNNNHHLNTHTTSANLRQSPSSAFPQRNNNKLSHVFQLTPATSNLLLGKSPLSPSTPTNIRSKLLHMMSATATQTETSTETPPPPPPTTTTNMPTLSASDSVKLATQFSIVSGRAQAVGLGDDKDEDDSDLFEKLFAIASAFESTHSVNSALIGQEMFVKPQSPDLPTDPLTPVLDHDDVIDAFSTQHHNSQQQQQQQHSIEFSNNKKIVSFDISDDCVLAGWCVDDLPLELSKTVKNYFSVAEINMQKIRELNRPAFEYEIPKVGTQFRESNNYVTNDTSNNNNNNNLIQTQIGTRISRCTRNPKPQATPTPEPSSNSGDCKQRKPIRLEPIECDDPVGEMDTASREVGYDLRFVNDVVPEASPMIMGHVIASRQAVALVIIHDFDKTTSKTQDIFSSLPDWIRPGAPPYMKFLALGDIPDVVHSSLERVIDWACQELQADADIANGFNIVGYGLGGLVARGVLEACEPLPHVVQLISVCAPQNGVSNPIRLFCEMSPQHCDPRTGTPLPDTFPAKMPNLLQDIVRDPANRNRFLFEDGSMRTLAKLNNEVDHNHNTFYKQRIVNLENLVLVGCVNDSRIVPRQSQTFGEFPWDATAGSTSVKMEGSMLYRFDLIGLRTLQGHGKLHQLYLESSVGHSPFDEDSIFLYARQIVPLLRLTSQDFDKEMK